MAKRQGGNNRDKNGKGWRFSARERRAVLFLLPLVAVAVWILWSVALPRYDDSVNMLGDRIADEARKGGRQNYNQRQSDSDNRTQEKQDERPTLFDFDPNTVTYEEMRTMGIASNTAAGIVKYRERGKVFQIPEDFATCYGITDSTYAALKPHINIGEQYRLERAASNFTSTVGGVTAGISGGTAAGRGTDYRSQAVVPKSFDPNACTAEDFARMGFSEKQADVIVRFRESRGGFRNAAEFAECYVVSDEMFAKLRDHIMIASFASNGDGSGSASGTTANAETSAKPSAETSAEAAKTDLNSADSLELVSVRGIGPRTATDIIAYRKVLGGFHSVEQLKELKVMTERNYEAMVKQIWADSSKIQKIDINFAIPNTVSQHPYISGKTLRRVLKNRQLKGGWSTIEDMIEDNTLSHEEAARLAPYLRFTVQAN